MTPDIRDYIRANRATYTPDSIRQQLLDAGHTPEAIDAAWREIEQEGQEEQETPVAAGPQRRAIATVQFWALLVVTACVALTVLPYGGIFIISLLVSSSPSLGIPSTDSGIEFLLSAVAVLVLGYLVIGLFGWWILRRDRPAAFGIFSGLATAFVLSVIVAGLCVALLQNL